MDRDRDFSERQAECATMLVAIAQLLLNSPPNEFTCWLRLIADEIDAIERRGATAVLLAVALVI